MDCPTVFGGTCLNFVVGEHREHPLAFQLNHQIEEGI